MNAWFLQVAPNLYAHLKADLGSEGLKADVLASEDAVPVDTQGM